MHDRRPARLVLESRPAAASLAGPASCCAVAGGRPERRQVCLRPGRPTIEPKAQNLIVIFLTGGFSHVDTFDYKPALSRRHGEPVPSFGLRSDETGSSRSWARHSASVSTASRASGSASCFPIWAAWPTTCA